MRIKLAIFFILIGAGIMFGFWDVSKTPGTVHEDIKLAGKTVPNATFKTLSGDTANIHDLKGKTVIINFWATWCTPCVAEFPDLLDLAEKHPDNLVLLAISVNEQSSKIPVFFEKFSPDIRKKTELNNVIIGLDTDKKISRDLFDTVRFPESYIIGPNMMIKEKITGYIDWSKKEVTIP